MKHLTTKLPAQECNISHSGSDLSKASLSDPRRPGYMAPGQGSNRKEVSFSLDEENNIKAAAMNGGVHHYDTDSLEALPEVTQSQVRSSLANHSQEFSSKNINFYEVAHIKKFIIFVSCIQTFAAIHITLFSNITIIDFL